MTEPVFEYDFSEGFARCLACRRTDFLHELNCAGGDLPRFPVVSYVRGVRQEDDLPLVEWLRRCGLGL